MDVRKPDVRHRKVPIPCWLNLMFCCGWTRRGCGTVGYGMIYIIEGLQCWTAQVDDLNKVAVESASPFGSTAFSMISTRPLKPETEIPCIFLRL
jgi:hypothetical protein